MNIHEYQAREILKAHGVNVPDGDAIMEKLVEQYGVRLPLLRHA